MTMLERQVLELWSKGFYNHDIALLVERSDTTVRNIQRKFKQLILNGEIDGYPQLEGDNNEYGISSETSSAFAS